VFSVETVFMNLKYLRHYTKYVPKYNTRKFTT